MLANGTLEVLLTSLFDRERFTLESINQAYGLRWHIEECYKRLKISAELENFSGIHLEAVLQEFWAHLVMCNLLALHMCDAQGPWNPNQVAKYRFKLLRFVCYNEAKTTASPHRTMFSQNLPRILG